MEHPPLGPAMKPVPVAGRKMTLSLSVEPLVNRRGRPLGSLVDFTRNEILVSSAIPKHARMHVAAHAVAEAWKQELIDVLRQRRRRG